MKLESDARTWQLAGAKVACEWGNFCRLPHISTAQPEPSTWVRLLYPPTAFSFDEAWLLCEIPGDRWLAWVPDHGEVLLTLDEFVSDF
ncbi:MAG: hypothetical protein HC772_16050 [Leptolyngbyaceae cyanobacterium CRU_2_3]|nr:hypothetical protein [Leptolyngbyaceae cyanobacterium CRU_2_3]